MQIATTQHLPNGLRIKDVKPSIHPKFSPNLWRFLRKNPTQRDYGRVWRDNSGTLWIGWIDEGVFLIGARLVAVLCGGWRCHTSARPFSQLGELVELDGFWLRYVAVGRCAIDSEHRMGFIGDESRFITDVDQRECAWCGHKQYLRRWTETVHRAQWENRPPLNAS